MTQGKSLHHHSNWLTWSIYTYFIRILHEVASTGALRYALRIYTFINGRFSSPNEILKCRIFGKFVDELGIKATEITNISNKESKSKQVVIDVNSRCLLLLI